MTYDRRGFLRLAALSAAAVATSACGPLSQALNQPGLADAGQMWLPAPDWELLTRMCYGVSAAEAASVREYGIAAWVEEQLGPPDVESWLALAIEELRPHQPQGG